MRGRPRCLLLRRFAPLLAVAALFGPADALAGTPSPDAPPPAPTGLAPDPAPGSHPAARPRVHAVTVTPAAPTTHPTYVAPARHAAAPAKSARPKTVPKPKPKARPHRHAAAAPARFVVPRIALPAAISATPARTLGAVDAALAGLALLAAAAAAGSGARLVAVWNRREAA
jgi:hypothetical protein